MGMTTGIVGIIRPDDKFKKMKEVWDVCSAAGVEIPNEVGEFFDWEEPDESGMVVDLDYHPAVSKHKAEMEDGLEVDLSKIDEDITIIRFVNYY